MIKKAFKHISASLMAIAYYCYTAMFKKDKNLWLFGAWKGTSYSDNPKYLFEYVSENHPDINAVWITKNKAVYEKVKAKKLNVVLYPSKEAKRLICHASVMFQSEGSRDIGYFPVGKTKIIQLYHSIPAKSLKWFERYSGLKQYIVDIECDNNKRSFWLYPSDYFKTLIQNVFNVPDDHFISSGFPRNDVIVKGEVNKFIQDLKKTYNHVVLYLPTHRNWGRDFDLTFIKEGLIQMNDFAAVTNICFLYKPHPNEILLIKNMEIDLEHIKILGGEEYADIYEYLYDCDCLISDYSGVIYDFLPSKKPIILFDYDLDNYQENDGGVPKDYFEHQIGPICYTWESMLENVIDLLSNDTWIEKRCSEIDYFNAYSDGNNCKRIVKFVKKLLDE